MNDVIPAKRVDINAEELIDLALQMVRIPSVSGNENPLAEFLAKWLLSRGVEAHLQEAAPGRSNVIATVPGTSKTPGIILNGHIDMGEPYDGSPEPYEPYIRDGRLHGAAISNMKGAVAAMAEALVALVRSGAGLKRNVILTGVAGECDELGMGTRAVLASGLRAPVAICGEPTQMQVRLTHAGVYQFQVVVQGIAAHQKERDRGRNAIYDAMRLLPFLDEARLSYKEHPVLGRPQLVVGQIHGGILPMATAPSCTLVGDIRIVPGMTRESVTIDLEKMLKEAAFAQPPIDSKLQFLRYSHPFEMPNDAPIVRALGWAHEEVRGSPVVLNRSRQLGVTDSSHLLEAGISTGLYGPGLFSLLIEDDLAVQDMVDASYVYALASLKMCS